MSQKRRNVRGYAILVLLGIFAGVLYVWMNLNPASRTVALSDLSGVTATVYYSPARECCKEYMQYLKTQGFIVKAVETQDMQKIKNRLGIPETLWSCHTAEIDQYFVEGHVPMEAIKKLLQEKPAIDGIALLGMPAGSPGMGGVKTQQFIVFSVSDGHVHELDRA